MTLHMDRFTYLVELAGIPKLWNVTGQPVTDMEGLICSEIGHQQLETGNIPITIAPELDYNTTTVTKTFFDEFYPKSWLYDLLWQLYQNKQSVLLNNFFELVFYDEVLTEIEFHFTDKDGGNEGIWGDDALIVLKLGNTTYNYHTNGKNTNDILTDLTAQIEANDNTVQISHNENLLSIKVGARLAELYHYSVSVVNHEHLESISSQPKYGRVEKKIQALATTVTTDLTGVLIDSENYITFDHLIKTATTVFDGPSVRLNDDSEQDIMLGIGVMTQGYHKKCRAAPTYYNEQKTCYFALFLVQLKTLINPAPESFVEPTEFREHLVFRLAPEEYTEYDLKSLIEVPQLGERAHPLYGTAKTDYFILDESPNDAFGDDTAIFPNYYDLGFTVHTSSNDNKWIIESDPFYGIYGYHINGTTIIKSFRFHLNNGGTLQQETLPLAGDNAIRTRKISYDYDYQEDFILTEFTWTDHAIYKGQLYPSRQLISPAISLTADDHWYDTSVENIYKIEIQHQTVNYLLPYHQYKNIHWQSTVAAYQQDSDDEEMAWRIASFQLKYENTVVFSTKQAYFFDGYPGLTGYDPETETIPAAFAKLMENQNDHMFFLAVAHENSTVEDFLQPITRITKNSFIREYPKALARTANIIDITNENAICIVHVGFWRNQIYDKCVNAYEILGDLLLTDTIENDFINIVDELESIYTQDSDIELEETSLFSVQYEALQQEIETERTRLDGLTSDWRANMEILIQQYNAHPDTRQSTRDDIKTQLDQFLYNQYLIIINNFATPPIINMLEAGQSYIITQ